MILTHHFPSRLLFSRPSWLVCSAVALLSANVGCSSDEGGGSTASGGAAMTSGGSSSGGASSGGAASGGAATGSGGGSSGGAASGGASASGGGDGSGGDDGTGSGGGSSSGGADGGGEFTITSSEFTDGDPIPVAHTCGGDGGGTMGWGSAPALKWENPPAGTMSYAFFIIDETLTTKAQPDVNGNHAGAWNIPTTVTDLSTGWMEADLGGAQAIRGGWLGPCPNLITQGNTDTYMLIVLAMPDASYTINGDGSAGVRDAYAMLKADALGEAILRGTSDAVAN